jgi:formyltetrahydrofolate dehydrogenase
MLWNDLDIRLVEEVKEKCNGVSLENEDVYMNAGFEDFAGCVIRRFRGIEDKEPFTYDAVSYREFIQVIFAII